MSFSFHPWEVIGAIQIPFYTIIMLVTLYPAFQLIKTKSPFRAFFIRYGILLLTKIIGGALLVAYTKNYTEINLAITTSVFNAIALGLITMLLAFSIRFVELYRNTELKQSKANKFSILSLLQADYTKSASWDQLLEKLTFVVIIINITGSSMMGDNRAVSKSLQEAGSIIYLVCLALISALILHKVMREKRQADKDYGFIVAVLTICAALIPFILVRMIYYTCSSFSFRVDGTYTQDVSKFTFLFGDWKYYAFIGFLEECICVALYALMTWVVYTGEKKLRSRKYFESTEVDSANSNV